MENAKQLSDSVEKLSLTGDEMLIALDGRNIKIPLKVIKDFIGINSLLQMKGAFQPATPAPQAGDFWGVASAPGTYPNLGGMVVPANSVALFSRVDGQWSSSIASIEPQDLTGLATKEEIKDFVTQDKVLPSLYKVGVIGQFRADQTHVLNGIDASTVLTNLSITGPGIYKPDGTVRRFALRVLNGNATNKTISFWAESDAGHLNGELAFVYQGGSAAFQLNNTTLNSTPAGKTIQVTATINWAAIGTTNMSGGGFAVTEIVKKPAFVYGGMIGKTSLVSLDAPAPTYYYAQLEAGATTFDNIPLTVTAQQKGVYIIKNVNGSWSYELLSSQSGIEKAEIVGSGTGFNKSQSLQLNSGARVDVLINDIKIEGSIRIKPNGQPRRFCIRAIGKNPTTGAYYLSIWAESDTGQLNGELAFVYSSPTQFQVNRQIVASTPPGKEVMLSVNINWTAVNEGNHANGTFSSTEVVLSGSGTQYLQGGVLNKNSFVGSSSLPLMYFYKAFKGVNVFDNIPISINAPEAAIYALYNDGSGKWSYELFMSGSELPDDKGTPDNTYRKATSDKTIVSNDPYNNGVKSSELDYTRSIQSTARIFTIEEQEMVPSKGVHLSSFDGRLLVTINGETFNILLQKHQN